MDIGANDGENFTEITTINNEIDLMQEGKFKHDFSVENTNLNGRYVKIIARNVGKLPDVHPASGSDAWIFIDEIIID